MTDAERIKELEDQVASLVSDLGKKKERASELYWALNSAVDDLCSMREAVGESHFEVFERHGVTIAEEWRDIGVRTQDYNRILCSD